MALSEFEDVRTFCHTCLSTDRILAPITEYKNLCKLLFQSFQLICPLDDMYLCWECSAIMKNLVKFLNRVEKVQDVLLNLCIKKESLFIKSFSTFSTVLLTDYQKIYHENKSEMSMVELEIANLNPKDNNEGKCNNMKGYIDTIFKQENNIHIKNEMIEDDIASEGFKIFNEVNIEDIQALQNHNNENEEVPVKKEICKKNNKISRSSKYKIIEGIKCINNYRKIYIKPDQLEFWLKRDRESPKYVNSKYKCQKCIIWFSSQKYYANHKKEYHKESVGNYVCDVCRICSSRKEILISHCITHFLIHECCICFYQCRTIQEMSKHFEKQHSRRIQCVECSLTFQYIKDFRNHYRDLHLKFKCDYCGRTSSTKQYLIQHMFLRHTTAHCRLCNITFKSQWYLLMHKRYKHLDNPTESTYCVECDMQFPNDLMYRRHVQTSVKHGKKSTKDKDGAKCPECGKHYVRKQFMMNHYRHVHLKKTNYYCQICDKYFLNATRSKQHRETVHEKKPKSLNEICNICGRGFHARRTLVNHMRTHTGERPNACPHCPARFVQKYAMQTHVRNIHRTPVI